MENTKVSKIYAKSIYDIADENNKIMQTLNVLSYVNDLLDEDKDLLKFLVNPTISKKEKINLIKSILKDSETINISIFSYLIEKGRIDCLKEIKNQYENIYYDKNNEIIVTVYFPQKLTDTQKERLVKKLEKMKNKKIILNEIVDENLIAGGIVKIKDEVIDGSLRTQIKSLKDSF